MAPSDNILVFPGAAPTSGPTERPAGGTSVRTIAARLASPCRPRADERLPALSIDLSDLAGVDDETIGRLTIAAVEGYLTCASAARLAMRHARELRQPEPLLEEAALTGSIEGAAHHDTCLRLALRADGIALDMAVAPVWSRDRILESGFPSGPAVAAFTGRDIDGHAAFATVSTADWAAAVLRLTATPSHAFAERVHLFRWSSALRPGIRAAMSVELGRRIALHGCARRLGRARSDRPRPRGDARAIASAAMLLIAATHPAIIDGSRP